MASGGQNHLPIEYISVDTDFPLVLVIIGFVQVLLCMIIDWDSKIYSFFLGSNSSQAFRDQADHVKIGTKVKDEKKDKDTELPSDRQRQRQRQQQQPGFRARKHGETSVSRQEVEVVFKSLGLFSRPESAELPETFEFDCNDLSNLFVEKEPSEDEVNAVFDVFDENKDGFIEANELQRLLCALGFREGSEIENCRRMIRMFDENGDERIDFDEFVKLLESSFR